VSSANEVRVAAVLAAAGVGQRMASREPKQYLLLAGVPVLLHAVRPFLELAAVRRVIVALPPAQAASPPDWLVALDPRIRVVAGGATRGDSVRQALQVTEPDTDIVLIHDAARPLVTAAVIERTLRAVTSACGAIAAVPVSDTIKRVDAKRRIIATPDRSDLWRAQTPQAFPRGLILEAYRRAAADGVDATDDAALVERYGGQVVVVQGAADNLKLTEPADLRLAEAVLEARGTGHGAASPGPGRGAPPPVDDRRQDAGDRG
jgi:2-C-methyl-D-erythritol 4-phosphate cytidylyltransferase